MGKHKMKEKEEEMGKLQKWKEKEKWEKYKMKGKRKELERFVKRKGKRMRKGKTLLGEKKREGGMGRIIRKELGRGGGEGFF